MCNAKYSILFRTMYNKFFALIISILIFSSAFGAKNNGIIVGKVTEKSNGNPLPFATVSIQNEEKKIVGGATTGDDGNFQINNLIFGKCNVKVSFIGFKDTTFVVDIKESANNVNLGVIKLSTDAIALQSALVVAKVPVIEQKLDKIVMNVSEAVSTQGSNALDVLKKAPGISVDPSGNILLNGAAVQVWIDGRPSNLSGAELEALLSGTDGSTIDKIEIISHPSAKYDAAGSGGIINIKTKKNFARGLSGSMKASYTAAPYTNYYQGADGSLNLNYRSDKTNTSITYSPRYNEFFENFYSKTNLGNGMIINGTTESDDFTRNHSFRVVNDIFLTKKDVLGVIVNGFIRNSNDFTNDAVTGSELLNNGVLVEKTKTGIDNDDIFDNISGNLNYTHTFKDNQEITLNADYGYYKIGKNSFQDNYFSDKDGIQTRVPSIFKSNSDQLINIMSLRADYEQPIFKTFKLETGIKWAQSNTNNDLIRQDQINNNWVINDPLSSKFDYKENISAAYLSLAKQFGTKWSLKAGLRGELTQATGEWISADTTTNKTYLDVFPTAFAGYTPNKNLRFGLSYTMRIQRPNFNQLNPFRMYIDASSSLEGNPNLNPQYNHQLSLSLGIKQHFSVSMHGQFMNGVIIQNAHFNPETGEKMLVWENFGKQSFVGGALSVTELSITKWLILNANVFVANVSNSTEGYESSSIFSNANFNAAFLLPKNFKIEAMGFAQSGIPYGYFLVEPTFELSLGIKKTIMDNKATIALNVSDILNSRENNVKLNSGILESYSFNSNYRSRQITLSFQYRFGQSKAMKTRKVGNTEEAARAGSGN